VSKSTNAKPTTGAVRPRSRTELTTLEVPRDLKQLYKIEAARLETTIRELTEEVLRNALPEIEKRRVRKTA
jgi:hypothetical protein